MLQIVFLIVVVFFKDPAVTPKTAIMVAPSEADCRYKATQVKRDILTIDAVDQVAATCVVVQKATRD